MNLQNLKNIQSAFSYVRTASITSIIASAAVAVISSVSAYMYAERQREKIYVLDEGKSLILALQQEASENRPVEAREHIRRFHELFFTITPDRSQIENNMERALVMADRSAYDCYQDIAEKGYYKRLISANIAQSIIVDSIKINFDRHPYHAQTWSTQRIIRQSNITRRLLVTECELRSTSRSDDNPGGFQIEKFRIIKNKEIETIEK